MVRRSRRELGWLSPRRLALAGGALVGVGILASRPRGALGVVFDAPFPGARIVAGWGRPRDYRHGTHFGVDLPAPHGTPLVAIASGVVRSVDLIDDSNAGRNVIVQVDAPAGTVHYRYLHLEQVRVRVGDRVRGGATVLGTMGDSGTNSGWTHLHLDVGLDSTMLVAYARAYGRPRPDFPSPKPWGTQVPVEPLLPVLYSARTVQEAGERNVALRA